MQWVDRKMCGGNGGQAAGSQSNTKRKPVTERSKTPEDQAAERKINDQKLQELRKSNVSIVKIVSD